MKYSAEVHIEGDITINIETEESYDPETDDGWNALMNIIYDKVFVSEEYTSLDCPNAEIYEINIVN